MRYTVLFEDLVGQLVYGDKHATMTDKEKNAKLLSRAADAGAFAGGGLLTHYLLSKYGGNDGRMTAGRSAMVLGGSLGGLAAKKLLVAGIKKGATAIHNMSNK